MRLISGSGKDKHEFKEIFERYWERLYTQAFAILQDHADAQDVIQDLFVTLWAKRHDIIINSNIESYLFQAVRNRSITKVKSNIQRNKLTTELNDPATENSYDLLEHKQLSSMLQQNINLLPHKTRQVADLYFIQGLNVKEIAAMLSLSAQTVRNQVRMAFRKLEGRKAMLRND
jgi:RNA polymerase sigma-70 factor (ECF subfamily)